MLFLGLVFTIEVPTKGTGWKMTPPELSVAPLKDITSATEIRNIFESRAFSFQEVFVGTVMNNLFLILIIMV